MALEIFLSMRYINLHFTYLIYLLRDYGHVRVNQLPMGSLCLAIGQFVKN